MADEEVNWVVPTEDNVTNVVNSFLKAGAEEPVGSEEDTRTTKLVAQVVEVVRGAIRTGGRTPISLTPASVPPEALDVVLILVMERLIVSTPRLAEFAANEWAGWTIKDARDWVQKVRDGQSVTPPTDPDPDQTPVGVTWGDFSGQQVDGVAGKVDLTTD